MNIALEQNLNAIAYLEHTESTLQLTRVTSNQVVFSTPHARYSEAWLQQLRRIDNALKHYCHVQPSIQLQHIPSVPLVATIS